MSEPPCQGQQSIQQTLGRRVRSLRPSHSHRQSTHTCVLHRLFSPARSVQTERDLQGLVTVLIILMLISPAQDIRLDRVRPVFQGYSRWREVLSHPSWWMFWKALGGSMLASWPLLVQELQANGLSSKPPTNSTSLMNMESKVSTTPKR